jgi:hypothetical protein
MGNFTKMPNSHRNLPTTSNIVINKTNIISKKLTITRRPALVKLNTTKPIKLKHKAFKLNTTTISPVQTSSSFQSTKANLFTTTDFSTTPSISSCENGGLLIDNVCICLNQFTGSRCEIAPGFTDQISTTTNAIEKTTSRIPKTKNLVIGRTKSIKTAQRAESKLIVVEDKENATISTTTNESDSQKLTESEDDYIPLFTISKFNSKTNKTLKRNIYWPWFGKFERYFLINLSFKLIFFYFTQSVFQAIQKYIQLMKTGKRLQLKNYQS